MSRTLVLFIKTLNRLLWSGFYFVLPPDENDAKEMVVYNQRLKW